MESERRPSVFLSYSRHDKELAQCLADELTKLDHDVFMDTGPQRLLAGEIWWDKLKAQIIGRDAFLFIVSQASLRSPNCMAEVAHAHQFAKRLIPVCFEDLERKNVSDAAPALSSLQQVSFRPDAPLSGQIHVLVEELEIDLAWAKIHSALLISATEWKANSEATSFLLRGERLDEASRLAVSAPGTGPLSPCEPIPELIAASRIFERKRKEKTVFILSAALVTAILVSIVSFRLYLRAEDQTRAAEASRKDAELQKIRTQAALEQTEIQKREAEMARTTAEQRKEQADKARVEAEDLVEFMQNDARAQLEKAGRLDLIHSLNQAVGDYFAKNPSKEKSDFHDRQLMTLRYSEAQLYANYGELDKAETAYTESAEIARRLGDSELEASCYLATSQIVMALGRPKENATAYLALARDVASRLTAANPGYYAPAQRILIMADARNLSMLSNTSTGNKEDWDADIISKAQSVMDRVIQAEKMNAIDGDILDAYLDAAQAQIVIWRPDRRTVDKAVHVAAILVEKTEKYKAVDNGAQRMFVDALLAQAVTLIEVDDFEGALKSVGLAVTNLAHLESPQDRNPGLLKTRARAFSIQGDALCRSRRYDEAAASYLSEFNVSEKIYQIQPADTMNLYWVAMSARNFCFAVDQLSSGRKHSDYETVLGRGLDAIRGYNRRADDPQGKMIQKELEKFDGG